MGLDPLDILFRVEHAFAMKIPNSEFARVYQEGRVGELHGYVVERLREHRFRRCLGPHVFQAIRQASADIFTGQQEDVMPWSTMETVVPKNDRQKAWCELARRLDLTLPPLRRPSWIEGMLVTRLLICLALLPVTFFVPMILPVTCMSWVILLGGFFLTSPWAVRVPPECATVKGTVKWLLRQHYGRIAERERAFEEQEIWHVLRSIVVDSLNVRPELVTPSARWREDLGAE